MSDVADAPHDYTFGEEFCNVITHASALAFASHHSSKGDVNAFASVCIILSIVQAVAVVDWTFYSGCRCDSWAECVWNDCDEITNATMRTIIESMRTLCIWVVMEKTTYEQHHPGIREEWSVWSWI
jgi:hypothetical protein